METEIYDMILISLPIVADSSILGLGPWCWWLVLNDKHLHRARGISQSLPTWRKCDTAMNGQRSSFCFVLLCVFGFWNDWCKQEQTGVVLKRTGLSILLTSLSNMCTFFAAAIIPIPALRVFSLQVSTNCVYVLWVHGMFGTTNMKTLTELDSTYITTNVNL